MILSIHSILFNEVGSKIELCYKLPCLANLFIYRFYLKEHGIDEVSKWRLVRVDENFRVIALGLPVPKYVGQPLDPPLRSRFQARDVATIGYGVSAFLLMHLNCYFLQSDTIKYFLFF